MITYKPKYINPTLAHNKPIKAKDANFNPAGYVSVKKAYEMFSVGDNNAFKQPGYYSIDDEIHPRHNRPEMSKDSKADYYDAGGIESLDIIKAKLTPEQYKGFLLGSNIKYSTRINFKHMAEFRRKRDAEKMAFYAGELAKTYDDVS